MACSANELAAVQIIAMDDAMYCQNCGAIYSGALFPCPSCQSHAVEYLRRWLNRDEANENSGAGFPKAQGSAAKVAAFPTAFGCDGARRLSHRGAHRTRLEPMPAGVLPETQGSVCGVREIRSAARRAD